MTHTVKHMEGIGAKQLQKRIDAAHAQLRKLDERIGQLMSQRVGAEEELAALYDQLNAMQQRGDFPK